MNLVRRFVVDQSGRAQYAMIAVMVSIGFILIIRDIRLATKLASTTGVDAWLLIGTFFN
jgi:Flp pilus assembly pilin Flp